MRKIQKVFDSSKVRNWEGYLGVQHLNLKLEREHFSIVLFYISQK